MKKLIVAIITVAVLSVIFSINWTPVPKTEKPKLDTLVFPGYKDTMYFVVNENDDTVDWFMYSDGEKLNKKMCEILNILYCLEKMDSIDGL